MSFSIFSFISREFVIACCSVFVRAALKFFVSWFQHQIHRGIGVGWSSFLIQVVSFLVLGRKGIFHSVLDILSIMLGNSGSYLNLLFYQEVTLFRFSTQVGIYCCGLWFQWWFTFQRLCCYCFGLLGLSGAAGAPTGPCWCYLMEGRSFPRPCCLVPSGGRKKSPSCWNKEYFLGALQGGRVFSQIVLISVGSWTILLVGAASWPGVVRRTPVLS